MTSIEYVTLPSLTRAAHFFSMGSKATDYEPEYKDVWLKLLPLPHPVQFYLDTYPSALDQAQQFAIDLETAYREYQGIE